MGNRENCEACSRVGEYMTGTDLIFFRVLEFFEVNALLLAYLYLILISLRCYLTAISVC